MQLWEKVAYARYTTRFYCGNEWAAYVFIPLYERPYADCVQTGSFSRITSAA